MCTYNDVCLCACLHVYVYLLMRTGRERLRKNLFLIIPFIFGIISIMNPSQSIINHSSSFLHTMTYFALFCGVCVCACMCVCVCVFMCVRVCTYVFVNIHCFGI